MNKWWLIILLVAGLFIPATVEAATVDQQFEQQQPDTKDEPVTSAVSSVGTAIKLILSMVVVIGGFLVLVRWLNARTQGVKSAQHLTHLGGVPLGKDRSVQLVKLGEQVYVLGVGDSIQLLDRIDAEAMDEAALDAPALNQSNSSAFLDTFKQQLAQIEEVRKKR